MTKITNFLYNSTDGEYLKGLECIIGQKACCCNERSPATKALILAIIY
jgi:hypothetical protein